MAQALLRRAQSPKAVLSDRQSYEAKLLTWTQVLSLMLGQAGLHLHTFPEVVFSLDKWTMQGYPCVLDKTPNRQLDIHVSRPLPVQHPTRYFWSQ